LDFGKGLGDERRRDAELQHLDFYGKYAHSTGVDLSGLASPG